MITPAQCRAARALLKWTQQDLARHCDAGLNTIRTFEAEKSSPHKSTLRLLRTTLEAAGVAFIDDNGGGVKLKG